MAGALRGARGAHARGRDGPGVPEGRPRSGQGPCLPSPPCWGMAPGSPRHQVVRATGRPAEAGGRGTHEAAGCRGRGFPAPGCQSGRAGAPTDGPVRRGGHWERLPDTAARCQMGASLCGPCVTAPLTGPDDGVAVQWKAQRPQGAGRVSPGAPRVPAPAVAGAARHQVLAGRAGQPRVGDQADGGGWRKTETGPTASRGAKPCPMPGVQPTRHSVRSCLAFAIPSG
jgi:hypothetical protein